MSIDRYDWHSGGDFPEDLEDIAGGTHIGFFLYWLITRDLIADELKGEDTAKVKSGRMTGRDFLFRNCDGKFWDTDVAESARPFVSSYYGDNLYYGDLESQLTEYKTIYHADDSTENAEKIAKIIDHRFETWKASVS